MGVAPARAEVALMPCPRCERALEPREVSRKATFHACEAHGGFVVREELEHALPFAAHAALDEARAAARPGALACPMCATAMGVAVLVRGADSIELDVCHACGGCWFDVGELERARAAPKGTGHTGPAPHRAAKAFAGGGAAQVVVDPGSWIVLVDLLSGFFDN